jgi:hypothetical protein
VDPAGPVGRLRLLTGDLEPGEAGADALHQLRRRLAASFRGEAFPPAQPAPAGEPACLETQLRLAVLESASETVPEASRLLLVRRDMPLAMPFLAAHAAVSGTAGAQTPVHVYGPFKDALDRPIWFDEFLAGPTLQILWAGRPGVVLVLPAALVLPGTVRLNFGPSSLWVSARALVAAAPAGTYAGWKVQRATLELSAAGTLSGNQLTLPASATCHLTIVPDDSEAAAPPPGPGIDAAEASVRRPNQAELFFKAAGLTSIRASAAEMQIFGNRVPLDPAASKPTYDPALGRVWIPFAPHAGAAIDSTTHSTLASVAGKGTIQDAGWCPTPSAAAPDQLGDALSGGMLALAVAGTLTATSPGLQRGPLRLGRSYLMADRGLAGVLAPLAENRTSSYDLSLWERSSFHLATDEPLPYLFLCARTGVELVQFRGTLSASLSQPRAADGNPLPLRFPEATFTLWQTASGVFTTGGVSSQLIQPRSALSLSNGLFTVSPAQQLDWFAQLASPFAAQAGALHLRFGIYQLLPILPDPYASNFTPDFGADAPRGRLDVFASWMGAQPALTINVTSGNREEGAPQILPGPRAIPPPDRDAVTLGGMYQGFVHERNFLVFSPEALRTLRMLDVSTQADQLGVDLSYTPGPAGAIQVKGVDLVSLGGPADVIMLPQMQWEPVQVLQNKDVGILPKHLASPDDGGPTLVGARTVRLTPIAPMPLAVAVVDAHNEQREPTAALFTLPFGIRALATLDPARTLSAQRAGIQLFRQTFVDSFTSAAQVRLKAAPARIEIAGDAPAPILAKVAPLLPGAALQTIHATDEFHTPIVYAPPPPPPPPLPPLSPATKNPPFSVLDPIDQDFNRTFGPAGLSPQVPIERIDLSGYGASCFSDWSADEPIGITNVRFEVLTGRTRYEVIQMRSILVPCQSVVVRTITLERRASGNVFRWDSGWQAVTPGLFDSPDAAVRCHSGAVRGFYNIRHIRDTPGTIPLDNGKAEVEAVYFDADATIDHVVKGATAPEKRVLAIGQLGFVQRIPLKVGAATTVGPLNAAQLQELLTKYDPVGGPIDCTVDIGGSGQQMRLTGLFCTPAPKPGGTEFAVACYGTLAVPRNEPWSVARITNGQDVSPVDAHRGLPLVRLGGTPRIPPSGNYRIADPNDLLNGSPSIDYGMQLTTGTHRLLFLRPEIAEGGTRIMGALKPVLADPYSLVGCGGLFPPIRRCLHLDAAPYALDLTAGVFRWNPGSPKVPFTIPDLGGTTKRFLIKSGAFDLYADYGPQFVELATNQLTAWDIKIPKVPSVLDVKSPFSADGILSVVNDLLTPEISGLAKDPPEVLFGGILDTAKDVITALRSFLPNTDPLTVELSTPRVDDPALRLLIEARFPIAQSDGSAIDIGIGKFRGQIGVGTEVRLTLTSFGGRIFFTVSGELQQPLLPKIAYVGGSLRLDISIDESGDPQVRLVTCVVASIGGDLIPGLVSLEGSVSYGCFLDTSIKPFLPGVALGMELRAKLLSGFIGIRFRADAAVGIKPLGGGLVRDVLVQGQFTASGSIVAAWVFETDFEKTFRFEQKVPGLVAGAFLVSTGMVPVPV